MDQPNNVSPSRPKRKTTVNVNYKEKSETDVNGSNLSRKSSTTQLGASISTSKSSSEVTPPPTATTTKKTSKKLSDNALATKSLKTKDSSKPSKDSKDQFIPVDDVIPYNWQPTIREEDKFDTIVDFKSARVENNVLTLKDGLKIRKGDSIYMICEPPGEPYYVARILNFVKKDKSNSTKSAKNYVFEVCWFYRPRDLNRKTNDSRMLYASLHKDECPLTSFRGLAQVKHKSEIEDLETYRMNSNAFYFDKLYDRYMIKMYEVLPTFKLTNLPENYYKALNKRYEYVFVEVGRGQDLLSAPKNCEKCFQWSSSSDCIQCLKCEKIYHLLCLDPPILNKPKRGFAWFCAACNRQAENEMNEKRGKMLESSLPSQIFAATAVASTTDEEEIPTSQTTELGTMISTPHKSRSQSQQVNSQSSRLSSTPPQEDDNDLSSYSDTPNPAEPLHQHLPKYEELAIKFLESDSSITFKKRRDIEEWPYRYLGVHAKLEDALDLQDRPYARATSRLGSKHQLTGIVDWFDHTVQYYDPLNVKESKKGRKKNNASNLNGGSNGGNNKRGASTSPTPENEQDAFAIKNLPVPPEFKDSSTKDYPEWLQPRPKGYIERGGDDTVELLWKMPAIYSNQYKMDGIKKEEVNTVKIEDTYEIKMKDDFEDMLDKYVEQCKPYAQKLNMIPTTPNFMDAILRVLMKNNYDPGISITKLPLFTRDSLKEPTLTTEEIQRFEASVKENGSELHPVFKDVGTQTSAMIVRYYYLWKKTRNGHLIWDKYKGRPKNRLKYNKNSGLDLGDSDDDSSYSSSKIAKQNVHFQCKHCSTPASSQWFRVSGAVHPTSVNETCYGLCFRCARLWRRYAIEWEDPSEVIRKQGQRGGNGWKRKLEWELWEDSRMINEAREKYKLKPKRFTAATLNSSTSHSQYSNGKKRSNETVDNPPPQIKKSKSASAIPTNTPKTDSLTGDTANSKKLTDDSEVEKGAKNPSKINNANQEKKKAVRVKKSTKIANSDTSKTFKVIIPFADTRDLSGNIGQSPPKKKSKKRTTPSSSTTTAEANPDEANASAISNKRSRTDHNKSVISTVSLQPIPLSPSSSASSVKDITSNTDRLSDITHMLGSRYESKFQVYNPFESTDITGYPLPHARNTLREIAFQWKAFTSKKWKAGESATFSVGTVAKSGQSTPSNNIGKLPLFDPRSRACCICREFDSEVDLKKRKDEVLICTNCGLNVHASCYGVSLPDSLDGAPSNYKWSCDPCSNDLHPIASTHYSCTLCNARESDHDSAIRGDPISIPDAFKRTPAGSWVHVICAMFSDGCEFGNISSLQPVYGTEKLLFKNIYNFCSICGGTGGGGLAGCSVCDKLMHVTCCQDTPGFFIGFEISNDSTVKGPIVKVTGTSLSGKPIPTVICKDHTNEDIKKKMNLVSLRSFGKIRGQKETSLVSIYCNEVKKLTNVKKGGELLRSVYQDIIKTVETVKNNPEPNLESVVPLSSEKIEDSIIHGDETHSSLNNNNSIKGQQMIHSVTPPTKILSASPPAELVETLRCKHCHNTRSLAWYASKSDNGTEGKKDICHQCYVRQQNNESLIDIIPNLSTLNRMNLKGTKFGIESLNDTLKKSATKTKVSIQNMLS